MSPLTRYVLIQTPGVLFVLVALWLLRERAGLADWLAAAIAAAWIGKDVLLYPLVRSAYESKVPTGGARLVGVRGVARQRLTHDRRGYIDVRGERWRARLEDGAEPIEAGAPVVVSAAAGLELTVAASED